MRLFERRLLPQPTALIRLGKSPNLFVKAVSVMSTGTTTYTRNPVSRHREASSSTLNLSPESLAYRPSPNYGIPCMTREFAYIG